MTTYTAYAHFWEDYNNSFPFYDTGSALECGCYFAVLGSDGSRLSLDYAVTTISYGDSADDIRAALVSALIAAVASGYSVTLQDKDVIWI